MLEMWRRPRAGSLLYTHSAHTFTDTLTQIHTEIGQLSVPVEACYQKNFTDFSSFMQALLLMFGWFVCVFFLKGTFWRSNMLAKVIRQFWKIHFTMFQ